MKKRLILGAVGMLALAHCARVDSVAAPPSQEKAAVEVGGELRHRFLGASYRGRIFIADKAGTVEWEYPAKCCQDVFMLKDGSILFNTRSDVKIVNRAKEVLWQYKPEGKCEVHSCAPLANGSVLITVSGQSRVVEVDKNAKVAREIAFAEVSKLRDNAHMELRDSLKTEKGTYIVAFLSEGVFRELDDKSNVLRTITPAGGKKNSASSIVPLAGGNMLIGTGYARTVVEMDKDDNTVWSLAESDIDGLQMGYVAAATRLANGNTLVSCYKGTYAFFEVTKDKRIVWSIKGGPFHGTTAIQLLD